MATTFTNGTIAETGVLAALRGTYTRILAAAERRREYHRTLSELSVLSERELADIGLCRADIIDVARRHLQSGRD